ncbi:hypothetical protein Riv7116_0926 [Rivularia sp. PCC 7116]|nr:hypothetical protein Riv7116_0926 [Rivularia sp. PCC 7116]
MPHAQCPMPHAQKQNPASLKTRNRVLLILWNSIVVIPVQLEVVSNNSAIA